jgi:hypothetical protein
MLTGKERKKARHSASLPITNITRTGLGVTQGLCVKRLASYRLSRGTCSLDAMRLCERNKNFSIIFLTIFCPLVSAHTARFVIQQFYVHPTQRVFVFCVGLEKTAIISLYSINCLVCITETESVYCAVRTGSLYIIQVMLFNVDLRTNNHYFLIQH